MRNVERAVRFARENQCEENVMDRIDKIARRMTGASKGTLDFYQKTIILRKTVGQSLLPWFFREANEAAHDFTKDLKEAMAYVQLKGEKMEGGDITVAAYRSGPGIEIRYQIMAASFDQIWSMLNFLKTKGYRLK
jgi:hypothetical protein